MPLSDNPRFGAAGGSCTVTLLLRPFLPPFFAGTSSTSTTGFLLASSCALGPLKYVHSPYNPVPMASAACRPSAMAGAPWPVETAVLSATLLVPMDVRAVWMAAAAEPAFFSQHF